MLTYVAQNLGLPRNVGLLASMMGAAMQIPTHPAAGALGDRTGRRAKVPAA